MGMIGVCCEVCWERDCNCTEADREAYRERHKNDPPPVWLTRTSEEQKQVEENVRKFAEASALRIREMIRETAKRIKK